ncbi:MAG TPA: cysteine--1-D-myo-inosityl 2-amino-2-deoxy-alpha-D-glucopyranoside ligase [Nocardioidaceae bacterium]|nr:cysteine--1-D-myo-inosityl 2-amino-2-deoxy-alpha-D-glucopyranoside ligase [Nocardioidaceae bacterium]
MHAWQSPEVPALTSSGLAPTVVLYDTSSGGYQTTRPGGTAKLYVCGITPYDATHLGHAATYLAFDLLVRAWRDAGHEVLYVQNVTDVDDPLIERAQQTGEDWDALAERETELFRADMVALRMLAPDHYIGAVESIELIERQVVALRERGALYEVEGDLYFPVSADSSFGSVSGLDRDTMVELFRERGGDPDRPGKKDPLDCLVWQQQRPGDPAWDSALGHGRPGWHIECTAIALEHLGIGFDVQGGGSDLAFPHHEMCASEAHIAAGARPFAQSYVHAGMVGLDGAKMSKSKGNLVFVSGLRRDGVDPMVIRLALLDHHYREDWDWTPDDLARAEGRLARWRAALARCEDLGSGPDTTNLLIDVRGALAQDLDAPAALVAVDSWAEEALAAADGGPADPRAGAPRTAETVRAVIDARLGVLA